MIEQQLIEAIQSRAWWPVVGLASAILVGILRKALPSYWSSIPSQWKPLPAGALVLLAAVADAWSSGLTWQVTIVVVAAEVATAWPTAVGLADTTLRMTGVKASMVGLVLLCLPGCSFLRATAPEAAGAAASRATLVCQALKGADRDTCLLLATLLEENNELVESAVEKALEGQACPVPAPAPSGAP